ncbi:Xaa-Pro dipeptidase [Sphingorhabdus lutea]|uniref:Xaa-Pro dipeptidase n=2 Tax=Sphingorhabdus lutea TaxID=1913578 RepID=A0A1L3JF02_9SPHN|nr:Xaa-Pro dipeptidase [Sphingorhabdus lutea]
MACMSAISVSAFAQNRVITADQMLDVNSGKMIEYPAIFVGEDGRITNIADARTVRWGGDVTHINLSGRTLLPGLIDMHVHLDANPLYGGYSSLQFTDQFFTVQGVENARAMLLAGFTTVRNVGSDNYSDVAYKQAIDEGLLIGPNIVPGAYSLGATGGHCDQTFLPPSFKAKSPAVGDGPDELRKKVREMRKYGAEVIKVCATGGVFSRNTTPGQQQLSLIELTAIVDEAKQWGLKTAAHAHGAEGIKAAIKAGFTTIEHASLVDDDGIKLAIQYGTYFGMDIFNTEYTQSEGAKNGVLEENLKKDRDIAQIQRDNFRKAHKAGVKMIFSTDAGIMPHGTAAGQFKIMTDYGMTPIDAIRAATINSAAALGKEKDIGQISVGYISDIIAVSGNPLDNIQLLEKDIIVIKNGMRVN